MSGFIGSHLKDRLNREKDLQILPYDDSFFNNSEAFIDFLKNADVVIHLAGVNRDQPGMVYQKNVALMEKLLECVQASNNTPYIIFSSSIQISRNNEYGAGKKRAMELLEDWAQKNCANAVSLVIPNVFGEGGRPFYNSVIATFCFQITHDQEPVILKDDIIPLIYINDLTEEIYQYIQKQQRGYQVAYVAPRTEIRVSEILNILMRFKNCYFNKGMVPAINSSFERDLYNTFITYMNAPDWEHSLNIHTDERGCFAEVFKLEHGGQISFSKTKPGITRGNHYHIRKNEKFCVVSGQARIRLRRIGTDKTIEFQVTGETPSLIEIPVYYTHNITNIGTTDLITLFWINEQFNPLDADTFFEEV